MAKPTKKRKSLSKITYAELVQKVQEGSVDADELKDFFKIIPRRDRFAVDVHLNRKMVDIKGVEQTAIQSAESLLRDASKAIKQAPKMPSLIASATSTEFKIVAEGDSWFNLPAICPDTAVDQLQDLGRRISNIARWGDTFQDIVTSREHLAAVRPKRVRVLLFSAGGNDALGNANFQPYLRLFNPGHTDPDNVGRYIKPQFRKDMRALVGEIADEARRVRTVNAKVEVFVHGYDYAIPRTNGRWLGGPLEERGFFQSNTVQRNLSRAIMRKMVDIYNGLLAAEAASLPYLHYVDLRGTVGARSNWIDELHAKTPAAGRLARKLDAALTAQGYPPALF